LAEEMAVYFENKNIKFERTGVTANVPNNDVARLMYYMQCVCTSINCNDDPGIQRFTNYANWACLTITDQAALVVACGAFSPDVLNNRVFFQSDALCGDSSNEFYTINQVRNQVAAAESIIIAGRVRVVNKIMTYKMQWMKKYYFDPMQRLLARKWTGSHKRSCCCRCFAIFIAILILIGIVRVIFFLKERGTI
jgi:hypothetical protein